MKARTRPEQIEEILNALDAVEMKAELETYIADLEARQPDRPTRINNFLQEVESHCSAESRTFLEAYVSELESHQQPVPRGKVPESTESLYWRSVRRQNERRARALKKQDGYK